ncbi:MAG: glycoside hydrolase family 26 protein [Ilumatobacter sp.]
MNLPQRSLRRRAAHIGTAAAAAVAAMLVAPAAVTADDVPSTSCEVQASVTGNNIVVFERGTATNVQLRQNGKWTAGLTGVDYYIDRRDASPADTYVVRLRESGVSGYTDVSCTTAPAPVCTVDGDTARFDAGVFTSATLRQEDRWIADVTGVSSHAADGADGFVLRLRLDNDAELNDVPCEYVPGEREPEPASDSASIAPAECRYVLSEDGTDFELAGDGSLNLRRNDAWLRNVTGLTSLSLDSTIDADYVLMNHRAGFVDSVTCENVTPEAPVDAPAPVEPPAPIEPPAPVVEDCTISSLLVPSCGVWLGAATPEYGTNGTDAIGLEQYESVAHNTPDVLHFYKRNTQLFPAPWEVKLANRPGQDQPSLLFYNWKPSTSHTWAQIAAGRADANIEAVAKNLKNYPNKIWLAIYHEPEDNVNMTPGSGMTPADYVAMFRHTVSELRSHGVTNAVYTWNLMGFERWWPMFESLYPGDDVVDWVCYDPYQQGRNTNLSLLLDGDSGFGTYSRLAAIAPDKPMCLAEWGVDVNLDNPVGFFDDTDPIATLADFPQMKMLLYWNNRHKGSYSLNTPTDKGRALAAGYAEFAASPIFNAMTPYAVAG